MPGRRETPPGDRHFQPAPIANVSAAFAGGTRWAGNQFYLCLAKGHSCPGGAAAVRPRAVGAVLVSKSTPGPYCPNVRMSTILLGSCCLSGPCVFRAEVLVSLHQVAAVWECRPVSAALGHKKPQVQGRMPKFLVCTKPNGVPAMDSNPAVGPRFSVASRWPS